MAALQTSSILPIIIQTDQEVLHGYITRALCDDAVFLFFIENC